MGLVHLELPEIGNTRDELIGTRQETLLVTWIASCVGYLEITGDGGQREGGRGLFRGDCIKLLDWEGEVREGREGERTECELWQHWLGWKSRQEN